MRILLVEVTFHLPGCRSLKEKRQRLRRIADKVGGIPQVAVSESAAHDSHQRGVWSFVLVGGDAASVERGWSRVEATCHELDAVVSEIRREWLQ